jgi:hypothetical protein
VNTKRQEAHQRAVSKAKKDTFETVQAEERQKLDAIRTRTAALRALRMAQERKGKIRPTLPNARVPKSATKYSPTDRLDSQTKAGRKVANSDAIPAAS